MKVWFTQIYIEPDVSFPFNHLFQRYLSKEVTELVEPSTNFIKEYGGDFELGFNVSAKKGIQDVEIRGPKVFRKDKDVEFTIFLPFDVITRHSEVPKSALRFLMGGVCSVFESLDIGTAKILEKQESLIEHICADATMFDRTS